MYFPAAPPLSPSAIPCMFQSRNLLPVEYYSFSFCILFLQLPFIQIKAQSPSNQSALLSQDVVTNFKPSLAVVIGVLSIMFSLTFILLLYAKFCRHASPDSNLATHIIDGLPRSRSRLSGIDQTVIESLPFFRFSALKGFREGLECAICLSKFEDIEILRLLPKCKHAFHINCLDEWLERHSSCPLCRHKISADDVSTFTYSNSLRFLWNQSAAMREESNVELYVQREQSRHGSSRFSIPGSFRKSGKGKKDEEVPIQQNSDDPHGEDGDDILHKFNHKIIVSESVLMKNRWSNLSSSDLMLLNSEMLNQVSSNRFSASETNGTTTRAPEDGEIMNIKEEMERKREFEIKFIKLQQNDSFPPLPNLQKASGSQRDSTINASNVLNPSEKRSMSEIVVHPRFREFNTGIDNRGNYLPENRVREEQMRRLWLPIAKRTVQWFANRERSPSQRPQKLRQAVNV